MRCTLDRMSSYNQPPAWSGQNQQTPPQWYQRSASNGGGPVPQPHYSPFPSSVPAGSDERIFAALAHLSAAIAWVLSAGWLNFVGPLIIWLLFRDRSPFVRKAAAGSFNFTLSMTIGGVIGWILVFTVVLAPIGFLMIAASGILAIVLGVIGAWRTLGGKGFNYPWHFRLLH